MIEFISIIGNDWTNDSSPDIDILVIIGKKTKFLDALRSIIKKLKRIKLEAQKSRIALGCYPTYKLKVLDKIIASKNIADDSQYIQLHLLIYPSIDYLIRWEPIRMVEAFYSTSLMILGSKNEILNHINALKQEGTIKPSPSDQEFEYLLWSLIEAYITAELSNIPYDILKEESLFRLNYIGRLFIMEDLRSRGEHYLPDAFKSWPELAEFLNSIHYDKIGFAKKLSKLCSNIERIELKDIAGCMEDLFIQFEKGGLI
jgi:hypothetical protein